MTINGVIGARSFLTKYRRFEMSDQDLKVIEAMEKYGGSFVKALAEAAKRADAFNLEKIKTTFSEYWQQYTEMAKDV